MMENGNQEPATALSAARLAVGWTQRRAIQALIDEARKQGQVIAEPSSLKTMLSSWENGRNQPGPLYRRLFQLIYGLDDHDLGFHDRKTSRTSRLTSVAPTVGPEMASYFRGIFQQHLQADNLVGPHHLVDVVEAQTHLLDRLLPSSQGKVRDELVLLACQYAEFVGWLHQDAGNLEYAMKWSDQAMDYALATGDPARRAYVLMRKCNIAVDGASSSRAIGLVDSAMAEVSKVPPRIRALVLLQGARAHAADGDANKCAKLLDQAHREATRPDVNSDILASYCSESYVLMEAASCWMTLGNYTKAVPIFKQSLVEWPSSQRRDKGLCLSRVALSLAAQGDKSEAVRYGGQALDVVSAATSARSLTELFRLKRALLPWQRDSEVMNLNATLLTLSKLGT